MWVLRSAKRHADSHLKLGARQRDKAGARAIESETLARAAIYLEESLRPFGLDILAAAGIQLCE